MAEQRNFTDATHKVVFYERNPLIDAPGDTYFDCWGYIDLTITQRGIIPDPGIPVTQIDATGYVHHDARIVAGHIISTEQVWEKGKLSWYTIVGIQPDTDRLAAKLDLQKRAWQ